VFLDFAKRYSEIIARLPTDVLVDETIALAGRQEDEDALLRAAVLLFNLWSEECHLHRDKLITKKVSRVWTREVARFWKRPWVGDCFDRVQGLYADDRAFCDFVRRTMVRTQ
jgi:hypothetical protein